MLNKPGGVLWLPSNNSPLPELVVRVARAYSLDEVTTAENPFIQIKSGR